MSSKSGTAKDKTITKFYATTRNVSTTGNYFVQTVQQTTDQITKKVGTRNYTTTITVPQINISWKDAFQGILNTGSYYQIYFAYTPKTGDIEEFQQAGYFPAYSRLDGSVKTIGNYEFVQESPGSLNWTITPQSGVTSSNYMVTLWIAITATINTVAYGPKTIKFMRYQVAVASPSKDNVIYFNLPNWLNNCAWLQTLYSMGSNGKPATGTGLMNPGFSYIDELSDTPSVLDTYGNADYATYYLNPVYATFLPPSGDVQSGSPSCSVQVNLSNLDPSFVGNQSMGQILLYFAFTIPEGNQQTFDYQSYYNEATQQIVSSAGNQINMNMSFVDKDDNYFVTLLTGFDFTLTINMSSYDPGN